MVPPDGPARRQCTGRWSYAIPLSDGVAGSNGALGVPSGPDGPKTLLLLSLLLLPLSLLLLSAAALGGVGGGGWHKASA